MKKTALAAMLLALASLCACAPARTAESTTAPPDTDTDTDTDKKEERKLIQENIGLDFCEDLVCASGADKGKERGTLVSYQAWISSGYIDVGKYYALRFELAAHKYICTVSFYDSDKNFIDGYSTSSVMGFCAVPGTVLVPEGAAYARFVNFTGSGEYSHPVEKPFVTGLVGKDSYDLWREEQKHPELKIVCLGDSLTEGDHGYAPGIANKHYISYPYYLAQIEGCEVVNHGRCGYDPVDYMSLYHSGQIDLSDDDVVLIMLGTNGGITFSGKKNKQYYEMLIKAVRKDMKKGAKLVLVTPPHATEDPKKSNCGYNPWVQNAHEEVAALAAEYKLPLIDAYLESPIQADKEDIYQNVDGLHLTSRGYHDFAEFIAEKLEEII